jgi:hypothetical protein
MLVALAPTRSGSTTEPSRLVGLALLTACPSARPPSLEPAAPPLCDVVATMARMSVLVIVELEAKAEHATAVRELAETKLLPVTRGYEGCESATMHVNPGRRGRASLRPAVADARTLRAVHRVAAGDRRPRAARRPTRAAPARPVLRRRRREGTRFGMKSWAAVAAGCGVLGRANRAAHVYRSRA